MSSAAWSHAPFGLYVWVPYHFFSDPGPRKRKMSVRESSCISCNGFGIRNAQFFVSFFSPYYVIVHWHEDDSSCQFLSFTLYFSHHFLDSRRESVMWWILWIFFTRTPSAPRRFDPILDIGMNSWTIRCSPSMRVWDFHSSCPYTMLNRRIHWFLL